jgi:hypothetical protein
VPARVQPKQQVIANEEARGGPILNLERALPGLTPGEGTIDGVFDGYRPRPAAARQR